MSLNTYCQSCWRTNHSCVISISIYVIMFGSKSHGLLMAQELYIIERCDEHTHTYIYREYCLGVRYCIMVKSKAGNEKYRQNLQGRRAECFACWVLYAIQDMMSQWISFMVQDQRVEEWVDYGLVMLGYCQVLFSVPELFLRGGR